MLEALRDARLLFVREVSTTPRASSALLDALCSILEPWSSRENLRAHVAPRPAAPIAEGVAAAAAAPAAPTAPGASAVRTPSHSRMPPAAPAAAMAAAEPLRAGAPPVAAVAAQAAPTLPRAAPLQPAYTFPEDIAASIAALRALAARESPPVQVAGAAPARRQLPLSFKAHLRNAEPLFLREVAIHGGAATTAFLDALMAFLQPWSLRDNLRVYMGRRRPSGAAAAGGAGGADDMETDAPAAEGAAA